MKKLMDREHVVGVAEGEKWTNGKPTGKKALLVFVDEKVPISQLAPEDVIEPEIDGMCTDVVGRTHKIRAQIAQISLPIRMRVRPLYGPRFDRYQHQQYASRKILSHRASPRANPTRRCRPICGGISISHRKVTAGTLGGLFLDRDREIVALTNNHVAANSNHAKAGDPCYQPGTMDTAIRPQNVIGYLKNFVKLKEGINQDSATVKIKTPHMAAINRISSPKKWTFGKARVGMQVMKSGRTTGLTNGRVIALNGRFKVWYDDAKPYLITNCIVTTHMSEGGDSGSLLLQRASRQIIGLLFGGSDTVTLHTPIDIVRKQYGLRVLN